MWGEGVVGEGASKYPVVMAMGPAWPNGSPPFWFRGRFPYGDIESCSPEVSGFLADLTGALSMACHLPSFPSDEVFPGNILLFAGHDWLYIALGGGVLGHLGWGTVELGPQFQEGSRGKLLCRGLRGPRRVAGGGGRDSTLVGTYFLWEL